MIITASDPITTTNRLVLLAYKLKENAAHSKFVLKIGNEGQFA